jgi:hypothetical protein
VSLRADLSLTAARSFGHRSPWRRAPLLVDRRYQRVLPLRNRALVYDVIPTIDIKGFAGDELCRIVRQKGGRNADVVDTDQAASGSL